MNQDTKGAGPHTDIVACATLQSGEPLKRIWSRRAEKKLCVCLRAWDYTEMSEAIGYLEFCDLTVKQLRWKAAI